ncbi:alkaline phosphatase family protein [Leptobacterium flavescens]|uniref:Alkaline phosphatase family protein n=1 Tax=Leptobacterium flavescens TaxID=472055 RepID=A0A6P0UI68_9FLAO|nr:alkaline phosphatase D family protein [Leptobacterium flavescens]NER12150.1 alkaline phosphatase family protein [Leptobacterium flavescens]
MKKRVFISFALILFVFSPIVYGQSGEEEGKSDFVIAFGSCNKADVENKLWDDILAQQPNLWIWGGDNIYADTEDMQKMERDYKAQLNIAAYQELLKKAMVMGTWDDHDYGVNDGGVEFEKKKESQQLFLDFLGTAENDPRRNREGVYTAQVFETDKGSIKVIVLDTRYHRTSLTVDKETKKRYKPNAYGKGSLLGEVQWQWLERELRNSTADFNVIVSSVQLISDKHGWEGWGNFPHEADRFFKIVKESKARGVMVLSGDRHISDFSMKQEKGIPYPIIDFTSSGLTHSATQNKGEENPYRVGKLVNQISFGLIRFDFETKSVVMEMRGDDEKVYQKLKQSY